MANTGFSKRLARVCAKTAYYFVAGAMMVSLLTAGQMAFAVENGSCASQSQNEIDHAAPMTHHQHHADMHNDATGAYGTGNEDSSQSEKSADCQNHILACCMGSVSPVSTSAILPAGYSGRLDTMPAMAELAYIAESAFHPPRS